MNEGTSNTTPKTIKSVCRTYRKINIYETDVDFEIIGANKQVFCFSSWDEAKAFVDAWYAMQFVVNT